MLWTFGSLLPDVGIIRNCARWSDIENVKLPDVQLSNSGLLENMLSIRVWDLLVTLAGSVICGTNRLDVRVSKNSSGK